MLRTRLASLALAASLSLASGCLTFCRPAASGCCPPAGGCCDGVVAGFGGVIGTPCCTSHSAPGGVVEGPVLGPQDAGPPLAALPLPGAPEGLLAPGQAPRLIPSPQAPITPYTP